MNVALNILLKSFISFFVSVCFKQHNILKLIQNEIVDNIRCYSYGVWCNNECGKLQVITVFIEIRSCSVCQHR